MLVNDIRKCRCKRRLLNPINLSVFQLWQVGLIMQHKGKTNRLYSHRAAIIYYAHSYHRTNNWGLTGATDSLSQHTVICISFIYHVWPGSANIWLRLVCYVYTSQDTGKSLPHISHCGPPPRCCTKGRCTGPSPSTHWVRSRNIPTIHSYTHTT